MKLTKIFMTALLFVLATTACGGRDRVITVSQLPAQAQTLIKEHFAASQVALVQKEKDGLKVSYDVVTADGFKLEFDKNGEWTDISCKPQAVPAKLIPTAISSYVSQQFGNAMIVKIERNSRGYEIELSTGLEVKFNNNFQVVEIDD